LQKVRALYVALHLPLMGTEFTSVPVSPPARISHECCANDACPCIQRVCSHSFFFLMCCGFVLLSSLPRILCIADAVLAVIMYAFTVKQRDQPFGEFLYHDVLQFQ
jgi:hypothetical protein